MKLFVLLSVLLVSALVAANPVSVQDAQTREDRVVQSGYFNGWFSRTIRLGIQEDYVITAFTITRTAGVATWALMDGGIGANFMSIYVMQPLVFPLPPSYKFDFEIRGQPQSSSL
ncbi:unnamed protein product [Diatraea saccharalis]|uniref:Uncharacterized protein n=1 Tax=Diatraea saccharalis TaxID=40085 RepID=A0A9P0C6Y3_9NEOP|nr:unnamed protein product [Diatraea saccharalis]